MKYSLSLLVALTILIATYNVNAQCKLDKDEIDKFSKERVVQTKGKLLWMNLEGNIVAQGKSVGGTKFLIIQVAGGTVFSVTKGDELKLLLDDDSIVTLKSAENLISDYSKISGMTVWSAVINYHLPQEEFEKLKNSSIETVRIYTAGNEYFEKDVKEKNAKNIAEIMECIDI